MKSKKPSKRKIKQIAHLLIKLFAGDNDGINTDRGKEQQVSNKEDGGVRP
jgi:hypothetical protein